MNTNAHLATDPLHHDPDNTIDRALSVLRDAAPRPGLEGRILTSLEHRATATNPGGPSFHGFIVKGWGIARGSARGNADRTVRLALWTATSAAVLAIASLLILHRPSAPSRHVEDTVTLSEVPGAPPSASEGRQGGVAMPVSPAALSSGPDFSIRHPERGAIARSRRTPVSANTRIQPDDGATTPTDAQALADLHAPSHPAPPLPLTPQERLFLHMLHYGNATQLAELDPVVRAQRDADEAAAFKVFFPDPPPLNQPGDSE